MEDCHEDFTRAVSQGEMQGKTVVTGSIYVKSLATPIPSLKDDTFVEDVQHFFAVTLKYNEQATQTISIVNDPDTYYNTINNLLANGAKPVVGSIYMKAIKLNNYRDTPKTYQTWYCCFMH
jgi:hypothetical protein